MEDDFLWYFISLFDKLRKILVSTNKKISQTYKPMCTPIGLRKCLICFELKIDLNAGRHNCGSAFVHRIAGKLGNEGNIRTFVLELPLSCQSVQLQDIVLLLLL